MSVYVRDEDFTLYQGDALEVLRDEIDEAHCIVTSPPYLDARPEYPSPDIEWWSQFFLLCHGVRGPILLNVGRLFRDGQESGWWMELLAIAKARGLYHHDTLVWIKPNANPIHGKLFADRHEYVLCLSANADCKFNTDAVRVPYAASSIPRLQRGWKNHTGVKNDDGRRAGRRKSEPHPDGGRPVSYVTVHTGKAKGNPHPAPMAQDLAEHLVKLASWPGQTVLDPFAGSGTTAIAARALGRRSIGIELDPAYCALAASRLQQQSLLAGLFAQEKTT